MDSWPKSWTSAWPLRRLAREVVSLVLRRLATAQQGLWEIPAIRDSFDARWGQHFHTAPELFVQVSGVSLMRFPHQTIALRPGRMLLVPRGMPHEERIGSGGEPFGNLVFMYSGRHVHVHAGRRIASKAHPVGGKTEALLCEPAGDPARYLSDITMHVQQDTPHAALAIRGLFIAHAACLLSGLETPAPQDKTESQLMLHCRRYINQRLANPQLSVKTLAAWLSCSPDYLSHCFRQNTGHRLSRFIHEQRIQQAQGLLLGSTMNVSEIALACGYRDPGHFARVFKQVTTASPRAWRARSAGSPAAISDLTRRPELWHKAMS